MALCFVAMAMLELSAAPGTQQRPVLSAAAEALNAANVRTFEYRGVGASFYVGQAYRPGDAWPVRPVKLHTVAINYGTGGIRIDQTQEMGPVFPLGGGGPFSGETHRVLAARNWEDGWNVVRRDNVVPGDAGPIQIWLTPHGFVKAALANNATTRSARDGTEVSFTMDGRYKVIGIFNEQYLLTRAWTWVDAPVVGDMLVEAVYSGYRDFGGFQFPSHIVQSHGGHPALDLWILSASANPARDLTISSDSSDPRPASPAPHRAQALGEGVYLLSATGTDNSLVVEMRDHLIVCEANGEEHSRGVIAKLKKMFPTKPIRYIVNTHHHWDHSRGLRVYSAAGATIVTHEQNREYFEQTLAAPRTLDRSQKTPSKVVPRFHTVGDRGELTDGQRRIELHVINGIRHAQGLLMVYLPKERLLFEADAWTPLAGGQPVVPARVPMARALYDTIRRLNLNVDYILPNHNNESATGHAQAFPIELLTRDVGRAPSHE